MAQGLLESDDLSDETRAQIEGVVTVLELFQADVQFRYMPGHMTYEGEITADNQWRGGGNCAGCTGFSGGYIWVNSAMEPTGMVVSGWHELQHRAGKGHGNIYPREAQLIMGLPATVQPHVAPHIAKIKRRRYWPK